MFGGVALPALVPQAASSASSFLSLPGRAWAQEKQELLSSEKRAGDAVRAKQFLEQHEELEQEIQECCLQAQNTRQEGQQLLDTGHFMSLEVWAQQRTGWASLLRPSSPREDEEG